jgi:hypothetical protein
MIIELPILPGASTSRRFRMGFFHFSNNNLAIRRSCAADVGGYDPRLLTSEDVDICFRVAKHPGWVACREPGVLVRHRNRRTMRAMVKQLWGWGINVGKAYRKTGIRGVYLYWVSQDRRTIVHDIEVERFPILVAGFFTLFHVAHALLIVAAIAVLSSAPVIAGALAGGALLSLWPFARTILDRRLGAWKTLELAFVTYVANATFMTAAFLGGLRAGIVFIPAPMLPTQKPDGQDAVLQELAL